MKQNITIPFTSVRSFRHFKLFSLQAAKTSILLILSNQTTMKQRQVLEGNKYFERKPLLSKIVAVAVA